MRKRNSFFVGWLVMAICIALFVIACGCKSDEAKASAVNDAIHAQTKIIASDASAAQVDVRQASSVVNAATVNPATPPQIATDLKSAQPPLADADKHLSSILGVTPTIDANADKAQAITDHSVKKEKAVESSIGYRVEVAAKWILGVSILGLILYLVFSGGNIYALVAVAVKDVWPFFLVAIHFCTFGITWLITRIHAHKKSIATP
jgi:hypothetical protein